MSFRLGVVVPCTDSKRSWAEPVRLGPSAFAGPTDERARLWVERIESARPYRPLPEVYRGVGWSASLDLVEAVRKVGMRADARVISAGLGLVPLEASIPVYSATFTPGQVDSVTQNGTAPRVGNRDWWTAVNSAMGRPRPLVAWADGLNGMVVAASGWYVDAISDELAEVIQTVPTVVFSASWPRDNWLADVTPVFDRRLREGEDPFVRGNDQNLNQRVAERALLELGERVTDVHAVSALLEEQMKRPAPRRHERRTASDDVVAAFIERELLRDPNASKSRLLRRWRDSGRACEQRRFGAIFEEVRDQLRTEEGSQGVLDI